MAESFVSKDSDRRLCRFYCSVIFETHGPILVRRNLVFEKGKYFQGRGDSHWSKVIVKVGRDQGSERKYVKIYSDDFV